MKQTLKIADRPAHVLGVLNDAGFQAHLVGGAVRNALMGVPVKDLVVSAFRVGSHRFDNNGQYSPSLMMRRTL